MTEYTISTEDGVIQSSGSTARAGLDGARTAGGGVNSGVDPRIVAASDDTNRQVDRNGQRVGDDVDKSKKDSSGKKAIDEKSAGKVNGLDDRAGKALAAFSKALGSGGGGGGGQQMPQVPMSSGASMPQAAMPSAPAQSFPSTLSNPSSVAQLASALGDGGSSSGGGGGVLGQPASTGSHGSPSLPGGASGGQKKLLELAQEGVDAQIPYAYGGGTLDGPSNGAEGLNGVADQHGDYAKAGFDCSSWARYLLYQSYGVEIPRTSEAQYGAGQVISAAEARPGDLVFPSNAMGSGGPSHVTVYVGDGMVTEAQSSGTNLMFSEAPEGTYMRFVNDPEIDV